MKASVITSTAGRRYILVELVASPEHREAQTYLYMSKDVLRRMNSSLENELWAILKVIEEGW